jgi:hypothetical protein
MHEGYRVSNIDKSVRALPHEQDGRAILFEFSEEIQNELGDSGRKSERRLVHNQDLWLLSERWSERQHLLLTSREAAGCQSPSAREISEALIDPLAI